MPVLERKISNIKIYTEKKFFWQHQIRPRRKIEQLYVTEYKMANRNPIKAEKIFTNFDYVRVVNAKCKYGVYEIPEHHQCLLLLTFII